MAGPSAWANLQCRVRRRARRQERPQAGPAGAATLRYEAYGPGGTALLIECLVIDRARARARLRRVLLDHSAQPGADGSVGYLFNPVALMAYPPGADHAAISLAALQAGAEEVVLNADTSVEVLADPADFASVRAALTSHGLAPVVAELSERAAVPHELGGARAEALLGLLRALEELEEVRDIYTNAEIEQEVLSRCQRACSQPAAPLKSI